MIVLQLDNKVVQCRQGRAGGHDVVQCKNLNMEAQFVRIHRSNQTEPLQLCEVII